MSKQMTVAIAGLGSRGRDTYAKAAKIYPDKMKIVAIADIDPEKVKLTAEEYDVPMSHCYESAEDMLKEEKLADVMIIATQDRQHVGQAIKALKKGYHLLLEKPISPDLGECRKISEVAKECKREVVVCHVLRYTPIYQKVKEILDAGLDTAEETFVDYTPEGIFADLLGFGIDEDGDIYNGYGVTDHYDADSPLGLRLGEDFIEAA